MSKTKMVVFRNGGKIRFYENVSIMMLNLILDIVNVFTYVVHRLQLQQRPENVHLIWSRR